MPFRGFSIIELIVVVAITSLLIVAMVVIVARFINVSREQFEQTQITEEARFQLDRLSDVVRNARSVDCNESGSIDETDELWLQAAEPQRLVLYSNVDTDAAAERVTYELQGTELRRTISHSSDTCDFVDDLPQVIAASIRNDATPLFTYIASDGSTLDQPVTLEEVARVHIELLVDVNEQQDPAAAQIATEVTPRGIIATSAAQPAPPPPPGPGPGPAPVAGSCLRTGVTVDDKQIFNGDGGCVYMNTRTGEGLVWEEGIGVNPGIQSSWTEARDRCESLLSGGRDDWRLPTVDELKSLSIVANQTQPPRSLTYTGLSVAALYLSLPADLDYPYWSSEEVATGGTGGAPGTTGGIGLFGPRIGGPTGDEAYYVLIRTGNARLGAQEQPRGAGPRYICVAPLRSSSVSSLTSYSTACEAYADQSGQTWRECHLEEPLKSLGERECNGLPNALNWCQNQ